MSESPPLEEFKIHFNFRVHSFQWRRPGGPVAVETPGVTMEMRGRLSYGSFPTGHRDNIPSPLGSGAATRRLEAVSTGSLATAQSSLQSVC